MFEKVKKFLAYIDPDKEFKDMVEDTVRKNMKFLLSLNDRQLIYYEGLHDSWRKELTRLEKRVFELERK